MGPLALQVLDELFCLDVRARRVGPGAFGFQPQCLIGLTTRLVSACIAVVREHPAASDALAAKAGHSPAQKADRCRLLLIGQDLGIDELFRTVDDDVGFFCSLHHLSGHAADLP